MRLLGLVDSEKAAASPEHGRNNWKADRVFRIVPLKEVCTMNRPIYALAGLALALAATPAIAQDLARARVGTLTCSKSPSVGFVVGSQAQLNCIYASMRRGPRQAYVGTVDTFGLDIGATSGGRMSWAIYAPAGGRPGMLAGDYSGAAAGVTVGAAGPGTNTLARGPDRAVVLQPLAVQGQSGANLALGISHMTLQPAAR
jgi:hypothetical protein